MAEVGEEGEDEHFKTHEGGTSNSGLEVPPASRSHLPRRNPAGPLNFDKMDFSSTPEDALDTARTLETARASRRLGPAERQSREKSLQQLGDMTMEERLRMFKKAHAAKAAIAKRIAHSIETGGEGGARPKTPREVEDLVAKVGERILRDVVEAARQEEKLVAALRAKARANRPNAGATRGAQKAAAVPEKRPPPAEADKPRISSSLLGKLGLLR